MFFSTTNLADSFRNRSLSFLTVSSSNWVLDVLVKILQNLAGEMLLANALSLVNLLLVNSVGITGGTWPRDVVRIMSIETPRVWLPAAFEGMLRAATDTEAWLLNDEPGTNPPSLGRRGKS
jgi:hypothetical protein